MRVAYLILAHKGPAQVARLVRRLARPPAEARFLVHADAAMSPAEFDALRDAVRGLPVAVASRRRHCPWGTFALVEATLTLLGDLLSSGEPFDVAFLLSGQDYPLVSNAALAEFWGRLPAGHSFLTHKPLPVDGWYAGGWDRIALYHPPGPEPLRRLERRLRSTRFYEPYWDAVRRLGLSRQLPGGLAAYGGYQWWALSRAACEHVVGRDRADPRLRRFFRATVCSDELFFQTVLMNSPLAPTMVSEPLHHMRFEGARTVVWTLADLPELLASGRPFARKFDADVDAAVLDRLDEAAGEQRW